MSSYETGKVFPVRFQAGTEEFALVRLYEASEGFVPQDQIIDPPGLLQSLHRFRLYSLWPEIQHVHRLVHFQSADDGSSCFSPRSADTDDYPGSQPTSGPIPQSTKENHRSIRRDSHHDV